MNHLVLYWKRRSITAKWRLLSITFYATLLQTFRVMIIFYCSFIWFEEIDSYYLPWTFFMLIFSFPHNNSCTGCLNKNASRAETFGKGENQKLTAKNCKTARFFVIEYWILHHWKPHNIKLKLSHNIFFSNIIF